MGRFCLIIKQQLWADITDVSVIDFKLCYACLIEMIKDSWRLKELQTIV